MRGNFKIISNTEENMSMRKEIITAIDRDGIEVRIHSLVFNIYKEKINLIDTIKDAVASYINSGYGFREYENNCYKSEICTEYIVALYTAIRRWQFLFAEK